MTDFHAAAKAFVAACKAAGFTYSQRNSIVTVTKRFTPGDKTAFVDCDSQGPHLLSLVKAGIGSTWGTDGGSVGGHVGCQQGCYTLNKSGVKSRFLTELAKV